MYIFTNIFSYVNIKTKNVSIEKYMVQCVRFCNRKSILFLQNNGAQQLASEATVYIMLEDVNDEIPLFTEREQETVLEGEPVGSKVTQVNAIDKDGTFPNNQVNRYQALLLSETDRRIPGHVAIAIN